MDSSARPATPPSATGTASGTASTPSPLSRGMSLHLLGIIPSPLSLRQFSLKEDEAEHDDEDEEVEDEVDRTEDSRDVLVDRLNDLARHLTTEPCDDGVLSALHARVDEMESLLAQAAHRRGSSRPPPSGTPAAAAAAPAPPPPPPPPAAAPPHQLAAACDGLADDLAGVLAGLRARADEAEQIQNLLRLQLAGAVDRAAGQERRAQRLSQALAAAAADRQEARESELAFLRLQLRAIEVQWRTRVPAGAGPEDAELAASIANWKADWTALQAKMTEERTTTTRMMSNP